MVDISAASKLLFFKAEQYIYEGPHGFDTSACPRPHFCMGLVLEGEGVFHDCDTEADISLSPGDIIFVPMGSRYVSRWQGAPRVSYISAHFIFDAPGIFTPHQRFALQKIRVADLAAREADFRYMTAHYDGTAAEKLAVLARFFDTLAEIEPALLRTRPRKLDARVEEAILYMETNSQRPLSVEEVAGVCNVSTSRFFPLFRAATGMTPVEYLQHLRVSRAIALMISDNALSIEEIGERAGFESTAHFRRIFKRLTGKSPREYRAGAMEI
ncbi:MAG: helix-turn-helix domain-containing protein [Ruminococcaceae bacterium]|nr:helix-turn-helix domain-containing protein [Oscillospiraceae bacterium]